MSDGKRTNAEMAALLGAGAASQIGVEAAGNSNHVLTETPKDLGTGIHVPRSRSMSTEERQAIDDERTNADPRNSATHLTDPQDAGAADGLGRPATGTGTLSGTGAPGTPPASLGAGATAGAAGATAGGTSGSVAGSGSGGGSNR